MMRHKLTVPRRLLASGYYAKVLALALVAAGLFVIRSLTAADDGGKTPPLSPPPSQYAPAEDLTAQVDYYLKRTGDVLSNKDEFDDAAKTRLKKDANTLAVLGLVLALHDDDNRLKTAAGDFIKASQSLAGAADYAAASAAFEEVKKAAAGKASSSDANPKQWEKVAALSQLMKQVPTINTSLKRGVTPARLKRMQKESAGHAAALAAIAQASMSDTHEVKNPMDLGKWYQYCSEMRDAAGQVNAAVRAGDQAKTTTAMSRLAASCETCHKTFRKEAH